jgi:hypothetical protein
MANPRTINNIKLFILYPLKDRFISYIAMLMPDSISLSRRILVIKLPKLVTAVLVRTNTRAFLLCLRSLFLNLLAGLAVLLVDLCGPESTTYASIEVIP